MKDKLGMEPFSVLGGSHHSPVKLAVGRNGKVLRIKNLKEKRAKFITTKINISLKVI